MEQFAASRNAVSAARPQTGIIDQRQVNLYFQGQMQVGILPHISWAGFFIFFFCVHFPLKCVVILRHVSMSSGVHAFPVIVKENKMHSITTMFR